MCRACYARPSEKTRAQHAAWDKANPDRVFTKRLKHLYGITRDEYYQIRDRQGGVCAICFAPPPLNRRLDVDHCHLTGDVRGLLCTACNRFMGVLDARSSAGVLTNLQAYAARAAKLREVA
jgi:hypothetical protein